MPPLDKPSAPPPPPPTGRLVFLDWVRILAFGWLVLYHTGMLYVSWPFHVKSVHAGPGLEPWMMLSSPWRMSILFLVSGVATAFMLHGHTGQTPRATGAWLRGRARRLLLPLLLGILVIVPPQSYVEVIHKHGYSGSYFDFLRLYLGFHGGFCEAPGRCLILPTWNHLWFLPYLMGYTVLLWCFVRLRPQALAKAGAWTTRHLHAGWLLALPILALLVVRLGLRARFPSTHALVDDWFNHAQYGLMFAAGAVLAHAPAVWQRLDAQRWVALALAACGWLVITRTLPLPAEWAQVPLAGIVWPLRAHASALAASTMQVAAIVAALGFAHRHLNHDGPLRRWLTQAVFPLYLVHQTVIILAHQALAPHGLAPMAEGLLIVALAFAFGLLLVVMLGRVASLREWIGLAPAAAPRADARIGT